MRKSFITLAVAVFALSLLAGCASAPSPVPGFIFTNVKAPMWDTSTALNGTGWSKMGSAQVSSILGWIAMGDASVTTAITNGGLSKVHHIDYESKVILGLYATFTVVAYGD